jgi:signal transduction histidine kinase
MESKLARTVKTFTFRLALVYVGLFSLSVIILFAFIYTFAMKYIADQVEDSIRGQYFYLLNEYRDRGSEGLEDSIKQLIANDPEGTEIYLIVNKDYEKLAGNLNEWPMNATRLSRFEKEGEWVKFFIVDSRGKPSGIEVSAITMPLSKWRYLLVGQSTQNKQKMEQTIAQTFWASLLLTFVMAFIGALIMTRSVIGRLSIINRSADRIMRGNLSVRIPFTKGGDEFDELSSNLNRMLDTTQNLLESLSQFANNIAHDLRSPLNRIISRLDAGMRGMQPSNPSYMLLEQNIRDLEELVATFNSILKISELEANTEFRQFEPCDLRKILSGIVEFYEPYAAEKNIHLHCEFPERAIINGEKNLLSQAFANLIDNALKFTPMRGVISITCTELSDAIDVSIADSGEGIPKEYHHKIFEKFFRMEQSRHTKGNGLGLSMVAAVARIHDATIILDDNNPGLKITLRFAK